MKRNDLPFQLGGEEEEREEDSQKGVIGGRGNGREQHRNFHSIYWRDLTSPHLLDHLQHVNLLMCI